MLTYNGKALKVGSNNVWLKMQEKPPTYEYCVDFEGQNSGSTTSYYVYDLIATSAISRIIMSPIAISSFKVVDGVESALSGDPLAGTYSNGLRLTKGYDIFRIYVTYSEPLWYLEARLRGGSSSVKGTATLYAASNQTIVSVLKTASITWHSRQTQYQPNWE